MRPLNQPTLISLAVAVFCLTIMCGWLALGQPALRAQSADPAKPAESEADARMREFFDKLKQKSTTAHGTQSDTPPLADSEEWLKLDRDGLRENYRFIENQLRLKENETATLKLAIASFEARLQNAEARLTEQANIFQPWSVVETAHGLVRINGVTGATAFVHKSKLEDKALAWVPIEER